MGKAIFCYKMHCPKKTSCFCARSGGSLYLGFVILLSAGTHTSPPSKISTKRGIILSWYQMKESKERLGVG